VSLASPESKSELQDALDELLQNAYQNGVTIDNGGYDLRHSNDSMPNWEVTIFRLE
jgi:hypothetical protein